MQEQLISFQTAKLAKEKGFEEYCFSYYDLKGNKKDNYLENGSSTDVEFRVDLEDLLDNFNRGIPNTYSAPTQSLLQKWLREVHQIDITVITDWKYGIRTYRIGFSYVSNNKVEVWFSTEENKVSYIDYNTYEEALEAGLQEVLKLIKNEN